MRRIPYSPRVDTWKAVGEFPITSLGIVRVRHLAENPFFPAWVDVGVGATVKWTNYGDAPQVLRSGTPAHPTPVFTASILPNVSFRYTFTQTGTFEFFLQDHPDVQGRVTIR